VKIAAIQHDIMWEDREANFTALTPLIREAAQNGARLVLLSEMFSTGFVVDNHNIGEPIDGPSSQFLSTLAKEFQIWIGGSCPEVSPDEARPYNSFVMASPDGHRHRYEKIHRFTLGGEGDHFRPGDRTVTIDIEGIRTTLFVCYDLRFADDFWAAATTSDMYLIPANWPESRREHWMTLLRARAIENQAYVVGCNRVGDGGGLHYSGDSAIYDPLGVALATANDRQSILYADVNAETVQDVREKFPFLNDRR
jgi:predicted amidohydrolase